MSYISQIKIGTNTYDIKAKSVDWSVITNKPSTFPPSSHKQAYTSGECSTYSTDSNTMGVTPAAAKKAATTFCVVKTGDTMTGPLIMKTPYPGDILALNSAGKKRYELFVASNTDAVADTILRVFTNAEGTTKQDFRFKTNGRFYAPASVQTPEIFITKSTSIANNYPARLTFQVTQTDNNITTSSASISVYDDHNADTYGANMVISSGGNMIIGGGESAPSVYTNDLKDNAGEGTYITSDYDIYFYVNCQTYANKKTNCRVDKTGVIFGAAWNDYAEFREQKESDDLAPPPYGRVVVENGDDTLSLSIKRLQPGGNIVSDTFGFAIGETDKAKMPIAVSGRVLAYPAEPRESYEPGDAVCTGPNGTVSKMTRGEIKEYPDRIIGYVSAIPSYETWGENNVAVDGRIWIKVA